MRQAEERPGLVGHVLETDQTAGPADDVEQVAMLTGGGIGPFAGGALAAFRPDQADEQRAARGVEDVAGQPVAALAMAGGEVAAALRGHATVPAATARIHLVAAREIASGVQNLNLGHESSP